MRAGKVNYWSNTKRTEQRGKVVVKTGTVSTPQRQHRRRKARYQPINCRPTMTDLTGGTDDSLHGTDVVRWSESRMMCSPECNLRRFCSDRALKPQDELMCFRGRAASNGWAEVWIRTRLVGAVGTGLERGKRDIPAVSGPAPLYDS